MRTSLITGILVVLATAGSAIAAGCATEGAGRDSGGAGGSVGNAIAKGGFDETCVASDELCNGVDDNCDGEVDEGCACLDGARQACFSGPTEQEGIGVCVGGEQRCDLSGTWGACSGETVAASERCDGLDNDCNGARDEGFGTVTCGVGQCQAVVTECTEGVPKLCVPGEPGEEACNGVDDDCDGTVDNGCDCLNGATQACYGGASETRGVGACTDGLQRCVGGAWGPCADDTTPVSESCDGIDNDCDGTIDNDDPEGGSPCTADAPGICSDGREACQQGQLVCVAGLPRDAESCNGLDDNCNDETDEGNPQGGGNCDTQMSGICAAGTEVCQGGALQCAQNTQAASDEICDNGIDDDCNGPADDGCCSHDKCVGGAALESACDPCVAQICAADAFCCTTAWDGLCQQQVHSVCGSTECGTCTSPIDPTSDCGSGHRCEPQAGQGSPGLCTEPLGTATQREACNSIDDCVSGHTCATPTTESYCMRWCRTNADCPGGSESCVQFNPATYVGEQAWGVCYDGGG